MQIWKWTLFVTDKQNIHMPIGAKILSVQMQRGEPQLWALVDDQVQAREPRTISVYGTGHEIEDNPGTFLGSIQDHSGNMVLHVFEKPAATKPLRSPTGDSHGPFTY